MAKILSGTVENEVLYLLGENPIFRVRRSEGEHEMETADDLNSIV